MRLRAVAAAGCTRAVPAALLLLLQLLLLLGGPAGAAELRVPRILHRSFLSGAAALHAATQDPQSGFKAHWLASCKAHNPGWIEVVWDEAAVRALLDADFPWFRSTYDSYPTRVQRSDVARYMALYKYGGVYLDADVECYSSLEASLAGRDLVLNCEYPGAWGQLHNAAMASAPRHPFWLLVLQEAMARSPAAAAAAAGAQQGAGSNMSSSSSGRATAGRWLAGVAAALWRRTPFHNRINEVLHSTGPMLVTGVYHRYLRGAPACGHTATIGGRVNTVFPLGTWFTPCLFHDKACQMTWGTQHFQLVGAQQRGAPVQLSTPQLERELRQQARQQQQQQRRRQQQQQRDDVQVVSDEGSSQPVIGMHHYSGSWTGWSGAAAGGGHAQHSQQLQSASRAGARQLLAFLAHSPEWLQHSCAAPAGAAAAASSQHSSLLATLDCLQQQVLQPEALQPCSALVVMQAATLVGPAAQLESCPSTRSSSSAVIADECTSACSINSNNNATRPHPGCGSDISSILSNSVSNATAPWPYADAAAPAGQADPHQLLGCRAVHAPAHSTLQQLLQQLARSRPAVLQLSCGGCEMPRLAELFAVAAADSGAALASVSLVVVDLHLPAGLLQPPAAAAAQQTNSSSSSSSEQGDASSDDSDWPVIEGLADACKLLQQQLGMQGVLRQRLGPHTLRLAWAQRPAAAAATAAATVRLGLGGDDDAVAAPAAAPASETPGAAVPSASAAEQAAAAPLLLTGDVATPCSALSSCSSCSSSPLCCCPAGTQHCSTRGAAAAAAAWPHAARWCAAVVLWVASVALVQAVGQRVAAVLRQRAKEAACS